MTRRSQIVFLSFGFRLKGVVFFSLPRVLLRIRHEMSLRRFFSLPNSPLQNSSNDAV